MKKTITIILLAGFLIVAASCAPGSNGNDNNSTKTSDAPTLAASENLSQTVSDEAQSTVVETSGKLSVKAVPDGWTAIDGSVLEYQYMKNTASFMIKTENFGEATLDGVVAKAQEIFKNSFTNYKEASSPESIKIDGQDAAKMMFTCQVGSLNMKFMYVYLIVGKDTYAITFGDLETTFDSLSADYESILNSITID